MIFVGTSRSNFSSGSPGGGCLKTWMDELGGHEDFYRRWQYRTLKRISQEQQSWTSNYFNWTDPLESTTQISQKLPTAAVFCCNRSSDRILSRHCGGNTKRPRSEEPWLFASSVHGSWCSALSGYFTDGEDIIETLGWFCPQGLPPTLQNIKPASITPRGWLTFRPAGPKTAPDVELVA